MSFSQKTRVGVLRGGPSDEYEMSLNTGQTVLANLPEEYLPIDIFISKKGVWHTSGLEKEPNQILKMVDVVINAMHGSYGEDGIVQKILENFGVPYTGSNAIASALGMNKIMAKNIFLKNGIKTPHFLAVSDNSQKTIETINENLIFPIIIKPVNSGSSIGISVVKNSDQIKKALEDAFKFSPKVLIEEFIDGRETTCGVIEDFRGSPVYTLLPVEILKVRNFFDKDAKYIELGSPYKVPGNFSLEDNKRIQEAAASVHQILGLRHYSRSDFILHPKRGLFVLEVNTLPEITHRSAFIKSLEAVGSNIKEFLSHILAKALNK